MRIGEVFEEKGSDAVFLARLHEELLQAIARSSRRWPGWWLVEDTVGAEGSS